jgi:hypothetical protein
MEIMQQGAGAAMSFQKRMLTDKAPGRGPRAGRRVHPGSGLPRRAWGFASATRRSETIPGGTRAMSLEYLDAFNRSYEIDGIV